ncbi:MAG: hypothetical protein WAW96_18935 [Alphaproteobacteria bacterium]
MATLQGSTLMREIEVAHSPWILGTNVFKPPSLLVGTSIIQLGEISIILEGAPGKDGLLGLDSAVRRKTL